MSHFNLVIKLVSLCLITSALLACSNEDDISSVNVTLSEADTFTASSPGPSKASDLGDSGLAVDYQMPTFIGADQAAQEALYKQLKNQSSLSILEQKQWLLLRLSLFATDKDQSLKKLESISDSLARASEQSAKSGNQDYELMAALGSALSYQSIFYQNDLGNMNLLSRKGMRYMDRAVKKAPNHLGIRLLRGISYANMPAFLNRASFAVTDLSLLKKGLLNKSITDEQGKKTIFKKQSKSFIEFINYFLALSLSKNEQLESAKRLWQALESNPDSQWSALASTRLKEV